MSTPECSHWRRGAWMEELHCCLAARAFVGTGPRHPHGAFTMKHGHENCACPQCQTHRWRCHGKDQSGSCRGRGRWRDGWMVGNGSCGCFSGSVLAGCCEE